MSTHRLTHSLAILPVLLVVAACGDTPAGAPAASNQPTMSAAAAAASSPPSPRATASAVPSLEGQIVFVDSGQDFHYSGLWLENADGSNVRQVLSDHSTNVSASLSPDGTQILFGRVFTDSIEAAVAVPSLFGTPTLVNTDGSDLREIYTTERAKRCDVAPEGDAWSPDGMRLAYVRYCFGKNAQPSEAGVWTINADGTDPQQVTRTLPDSKVQDHRASWSADGKSLTFQRIDTSASPERSAIFTIGVDGNGLFQVTPWSLDGNDPDWSPDGTLIAFNASAEPSPTQNIYTIHPDGTGLTQLTKYSESGQATFHPSWSPDGTRILFSHSPSTDGWGDFFVMDRDGSDQHVIAKTALHENQGQWGGPPAR